VAGEPAIGEGPAARPPLALIFCITLTGILNNTLLQPSIPDILEDFGADDSSGGLLVASGTIAGVVVAPVMGVLADRLGRRRVLVPLLLGFGVFGGLQALAPNLPTFLLFRFLQGVGGAGLLNLAITIIGDHWTGPDRARALARNAAVITVSIAAFPPIGGWLAELGTWRLALAPYSLGIVTAVVMWYRLPDVRPERTALLPHLRAASGYLRAPDVMAAIAAGFVLFALVFGLFLTVLPFHLEEEFGFSAGSRGLVFAAPALSSTIAALTLGRLRDRFLAPPLAVAAWALVAVGFVGIGMADSITVLLVAALVYGAGEGLLIPTLQDTIAGAAPETHRGAVVSVFGGVVRLGQTIGPLGLGALLAATSTGTPFVVGGAIAAGGVVLHAATLRR
jgi:MFS transporter, ACDE family, multidrug resistance protein